MSRQEQRDRLRRERARRTLRFEALEQRQLLNADFGSAAPPVDVRVEAAAIGAEIRVQGVVSGQADPIRFPTAVIGANPKTKSFRIFNLGDADLTLAASITGNSLFTISQHPDPVVKPNDSTVLTISLGTMGGQMRNGMATVMLDTNDADGDEDPFTFDVEGAVRQRRPNPPHGPEIRIAGVIDDQAEPIIFPTALVGTRGKTRTFKILNTGDKDLVIDGIRVLSDPTFSVTREPASIVPPNGMTTFDITLRDDHARPLVESRIVVNSNDADEGRFEFNVEGSVRRRNDAGGGAGVALRPEITVRQTSPGPIRNILDASTIDLGTLAPGSRIRFRVTNDGNDVLRLTPEPMNTEVVTVDDPRFTVSRQPRRVLDPNRSAVFEITVPGTNLDSFNVSVRLASNDRNENPFNFKLKGRVGIDPAAATSTLLGNA